jgi:hypothetical protein
MRRFIDHSSRRNRGVIEGIDNFGFTTVELNSNEIIMQQRGVFRTNCLDWYVKWIYLSLQPLILRSLDRTNFVQDILSKSVLEQYFLQTRPECASSHSVWAYHRELWAENGDALSKIYVSILYISLRFPICIAGGHWCTQYQLYQNWETNAWRLIVFTADTDEDSRYSGLLSDATKSVSRAYINNFQDRSKQVAIDLLLVRVLSGHNFNSLITTQGNIASSPRVHVFDPIHDSVRAALASRLPEYSTVKHITIFVGTWNLNGRAPSESLLPWLFPTADSLEYATDILKPRN